MGAPPAFPGQAPPNFFNLPPGMAPPPGLGGPPGSGPGRPLYPSMDTSAMGTKGARQGDAGNGPEAKRQRMDPTGGEAHCCCAGPFDFCLTLQAAVAVGHLACSP